MDLDAGTRSILDLDVLLDPFWSADRLPRSVSGPNGMDRGDLFKGRMSKGKSFFASIGRMGRINSKTIFFGLYPDHPVNRCKIPLPSLMPLRQLPERCSIGDRVAAM